MVFGKQHMDRERYALVKVTTTEDWLTCGGDEPESTGWDEMKEVFPLKVLPTSTHNPAQVSMEFVEWEDELPERKVNHNG